MNPNPSDFLFKFSSQHSLPSPQFTQVSEEGPPHMRTFTWECRFQNLTSRGYGRSKKEAKNAAAMAIKARISEVQMTTETVPNDVNTYQAKMERKRRRMEERAKAMDAAKHEADEENVPADVSEGPPPSKVPRKYDYHRHVETERRKEEERFSVSRSFFTTHWGMPEGGGNSILGDYPSFGPDTVPPRGRKEEDFCSPPTDERLGLRGRMDEDEFCNRPMRGLMDDDGFSPTPFPGPMFDGDLPVGHGNNGPPFGHMDGPPFGDVNGQPFGDMGCDDGPAMFGGPHPPLRGVRDPFFSRGPRPLFPQFGPQGPQPFFGGQRPPRGFPQPNSGGPPGRQPFRDPRFFAADATDISPATSTSSAAEDRAPSFENRLAKCEDVGLMPYKNPLFYGNELRKDAADAASKGGKGASPLKKLARNINFPKQSFADRHVQEKHAQIYPKEAEMRSILRLAEKTEAGLKVVARDWNSMGRSVEGGASKAAAEAKNSLLGISRVGDLAKGLVLADDHAVNLVLICQSPPTSKLLEMVQEKLLLHLNKKAKEDATPTTSSSSSAGCSFEVHGFEEEAGFCVVQIEEGMEGNLPYAVNVTLTCSTMRDFKTVASKENDDNESRPLSRVKCQQALTEMRHANWFTSTVPALPSCLESIRIVKELSHRDHVWTRLSDWAIELLCEKALRTEPTPVLGPAKAIRRIFEVVSTGILLPGGTGLLDPCERQPEDAAENLSLQQREDLTASAQTFVRMIEFDRIHEVLGMEKLMTRHKKKLLKDTAKKEEALEEKKKTDESAETGNQEKEA